MLICFAASPFDKLLGHCAYNQSQLMLFCVSLHANLDLLRLTVTVIVASKSEPKLASFKLLYIRW